MSSTSGRPSRKFRNLSESLTYFSSQSIASEVDLDSRSGLLASCFLARYSASAFRQANSKLPDRLSYSPRISVVLGSSMTLIGRPRLDRAAAGPDISKLEGLPACAVHLLQFATLCAVGPSIHAEIACGNYLASCKHAFSTRFSPSFFGQLG